MSIILYGSKAVWLYARSLANLDKLSDQAV